MTIGVGGAVLLALMLRVMNIFDAPIRTDEPTITLRAVAAAQGQLVPSGFDYPPFAAYVLAVVLRLVAVVDPDVLVDPYPVSRLVFLVLSCVGVGLVGWLGVLVGGEDPRRRLLFGVGSAVALAVSFSNVRLGAHARPDQVQLLTTVFALIATILWSRIRSMRWLVLAGVGAGLAAATKYVGGVVVLTTVAAILAAHGRDWRTSVRDTTLFGAVSMVFFVIGTAGTVIIDTPGFIAGFTGEFSHQAGRHLGYEPNGNALVFHLTQSLPGNWGWPMTIAALAGIGLSVWQGSRAERLIVIFAVTGMGFAILSQVRFPHYVLLALPALAILAMVTVDRLWRLDMRAGVAVLLLLVVSLVPVSFNAIRSGRVLGAPSTQDLAIPLENVYSDELVIEAYTARGVDRVATLYTVADDPSLVTCGCVVAISSYQEDRYRNRPDLYPDQIAAYDQIRDVGEQIGGVSPGRPLAYNWDLLPQWGIGDIPLTGDIGPVGPAISLWRMPAASGG
ncbi:MAG: glycosyltransferase family 39 protein [Euzebya sp.]